MRIHLISSLTLLAGLAPGVGANQDAPPEPALRVDQATPATPEVADSSNPVEAGLARAKKEKKYLLVAVLNRDDPDSERFEKEMLRAPSVVSWMEHKGNLITLYADDEVGRDFLGARKIETIPAVVIMSSDGRELGRQSGETSPSRFLVRINGSVRGRSVRGAAGVRAWSGEDVVVSTVERAATLTAVGKHAEALKEYDWCFGHKATNSPLFPVTHLPKLVDGFVALAGVYQPARDELEDKIAKAEADTLGTSRPHVRAYYFLKYVYTAQDREERLILHYDQLQRRYPNGNAPLSFARLIYEPLLRARRYEALQETVSDPESVDVFLDESRQIRRGAAEVRRLLSNRYEILLGLEQARDAKDVEIKLLGYDTSGATYLALAEAGLRSGHSTDEHIGLARRADDLFSRNNSQAIVAVAKLLAARTPRDPQVIGMLRAAMSRLTSEEDRVVLQTGIADIQHNRIPLRAGDGK